MDFYGVHIIPCLFISTLLYELSEKRENTENLMF